MIRPLTITVYGHPAPQGSKRFLGFRGGKGLLIESSPRLKPWRQSVTWAAREVLLTHDKLCGPVIVEMIFTMPKPITASKRLKTWPDKAPDLSKLVRAAEDSLTDAGIWEDDARVVSCLAHKVFPGEHADALDTPGVVIRLRSAIHTEQPLLLWDSVQNL